MLPYSIETDYQPLYLGGILNLFTWFLPLLIIVVLSLYTMWEIRVIIKNKTQHLSHSSSQVIAANEARTSGKRLFWWRRKFNRLKTMRLSVQLRFTIIIFSYVSQWIPPCILTITNMFCGHCIVGTAVHLIYWLTFTVCAVDPLIVFIFNVNVNLLCNCKRK